MDITLTAEQILEDIAKARSDDPVFVMKSNEQAPSPELRTFIEQQSELCSIRQGIKKELDAGRQFLSDAIDKEEGMK